MSGKMASERIRMGRDVTGEGEQQKGRRGGKTIYNTQCMGTGCGGLLGGEKNHGRRTTPGDNKINPFRRRTTAARPPPPPPAGRTHRPSPPSLSRNHVHVNKHFNSFCLLFLSFTRTNERLERIQGKHQITGQLHVDKELDQIVHSQNCTSRCGSPGHQGHGASRRRLGKHAQQHSPCQGSKSNDQSHKKGWPHGEED